MAEGRSRTLLWVLIGGGAFFLFVLAVFTLVYLTLHAGGTEATITGFGDRIGVVDLDGVILSPQPVDVYKRQQECLERIERLNPALNAFITVMGESALAEARNAAAEIRRGEWRGPLHGVPVALKDLIDTAGVRTTAASSLYKDRVPHQDAEVVRRLRQAGAVILGKNNLHEFAYGGSSLVSYFGDVHNPWDVGRIAGLSLIHI